LAQAALAQRNVQLEEQLQALVAEQGSGQQQQQRPGETFSSAAAGGSVTPGDAMAAEACANGCSDASWQDAAIQARRRGSARAIFSAIEQVVGAVCSS